MPLSRKLLYPTIAAAALIFAVTMPAPCAARDDVIRKSDMSAMPVLMSDETLDRLRGGFIWSGMNIHFGADIRTYVDGNLMLHTILNWTDEGAQTTQTAAPGLTAVDASVLEGRILSNGAIRMQIGEAPVYLLNGGRTAISHVTDEGVQNRLINTADGFSAVQELNATIDIGGYEDFRAGLMFERMAGALDDAARQGAIGGLGN
ncbi:hypothetical protein ACFOWX_03970 [Sphingorhabdus arenilitoris]|uniref:Uncharacterized protein n=1 Tax=Sphingorhabdus arenilitoris TaxID=1490041 RepID=A0ABV8RDY7_9SPHN